MRLKGHDNGLPAEGFRSFFGLVKKSQVAFMHPVKVADGQHRAGERVFDFVEVKDDLHDKNSKGSLIKY